MGACGPGVETCLSDGQWGMCEGGNGESEICGDGIDQDCDGSDLRMPDSFEPNDSCGLCKYLTATVDPQKESISASFDWINMTSTVSVSTRGITEAFWTGSFRSTRYSHGS